jgi:nicotinate-nucleotide--dimethylbenzimidazole phosphoribosyltransferase
VLLEQTIERVGPLDAAAMAAARQRHDRLTKPPGSLGRLEELAIRLAGATGRPVPSLDRKAVVVMAADHGVAAEGVSAYPAEVTPQMVLNFLNGGAAINVLARQAGARVVVVDLGVAAPLPEHRDLVSRPIAPGTGNIARGPAMSRDQARRCLETGIAVLEDQRAIGLDLVGTGDMGIGNTTPSSAIVAVFTGARPVDVTGLGTGITSVQLRHKVRVVERALRVNRPDPADPIDVLAKVGGFEIGALAGVILGAAAARCPIVIDGFISGAAALIATELCPASRDYLIAAHTSVEIGHRVMLERMELAPLLNLNLRLGEGTGAALAMPLLDSAVRVLGEMATFSEAGVSDAKAVPEAGATGPDGVRPGGRPR